MNPRVRMHPGIFSYGKPFLHFGVSVLIKSSALGKIQFLTLYDIENGKTPSGELYGAKLHGERAERAQNKSIGKGKESKSDNYYSSD